LETKGHDQGRRRKKFTFTISSADEFLVKFWDPSISPEQLKLGTSNLACRLATKGPKQKMQN